MADDEGGADEANELHFFAALSDELMPALLAAGVLLRVQFDEIEAWWRSASATPSGLVNVGCDGRT